MFSVSRGMTSPFAKTWIAIALVIAASWGVLADDYVTEKMPSPVAKAYFAAVPGNLTARKIARGDAQDTCDDNAYFTEDGAISIPPGAMVCFKMAGRCMDPHLPAPASGEPMQFVDTGNLIPARLRDMYDNLISRQTKGDPKVLKNNPQHLVWAIRTAGTDDPLANNLSDSQLEVLDECAGRRGAFLKYHEKEKKRNARKNKKRGGSSGGNRISVGGLSYDASELTGTGGVRRIESHISTLTEMGEKSKVRTENDFRYGEIEDELYSDIACDGGLSFSAKILNASDHRKEFRAADFAAQVGNGSVKGGMRQRVTMGTPDEIMVVAGAVAEGVEIDRNVSIAEIEGEATQRIRGRAYRRRTTRSGEGHTRTERTSEKKRKSRTESTLVEEEITPVPPVPPIPSPKLDFDETNIVTHLETPVFTVIDLQYDANSATGMMTVKIGSCTVKKARKWLSKYWEELLFGESHYLASKADGIRETAKTIPRKAEYEATGMPNKGFTIYISFLVKPKNDVNARAGKGARRNDEM